MNEKTKIKPVPFFSFKFHDRLNLPDSRNYDVLFIRKTKYSWEHTRVQGIKSNKVTISKEEFLPDTEYKVQVSN